MKLEFDLMENNIMDFNKIIIVSTKLHIFKVYVVPCVIYCY